MSPSCYIQPDLLINWLRLVQSSHSQQGVGTQPAWRRCWRLNRVSQWEAPTCELVWRVDQQFLIFTLSSYFWVL